MRAVTTGAIAVGGAALAFAPEFAVASVTVEVELTTESLAIDAYATAVSVPDTATALGDLASHLNLGMSIAQAVYDCESNRSRCASDLGELGAGIGVSGLEQQLRSRLFTLLARLGELGDSLEGERLRQYITNSLNPSPQCS